MISAAFQPAFATAAETAAAVRRKQISASELMQETLRRIDRHNPALNAVVWQDREAALARARQADEVLARGGAAGAIGAAAPKTRKTARP